ncbi:MAG: squalene/phytoene synthase family protein [Gammaproteobacteria bacterium]|nr:squalene/phytoene synthase family protein [Gammaproteobacteria bacterium]
MTIAPCRDDEGYQTEILQGVSRTFALTIPQLPPPLARAVGNAYLLCRIADTIEDDARLALDDKERHATRFVRVVNGLEDAASFGHDLLAVLSPNATAAEHDLIAHTAAVLRITHSLPVAQREALTRCVAIMARGMIHYQRTGSREGVADQAAMDRYCYFVAGVVGEMLTELFCLHAPDIGARRATLLPLAISFGQGLQMTNILKDIWADQARGACWLPRDLFLRYGVELRDLVPGRNPPGFETAMRQLIGIAHGHLANALRYTLLIPAREAGIRRFCLWALGMAVLTLRKLNARPNYASGDQVKISRRAVRGTVLATNLAVRHDPVLRALFAAMSRGLPSSVVTAIAPPPL